MNFNAHSNLVGRHAFLAPSKHSWVNYDEEQLRTFWLSTSAKTRGIMMHELAKSCILLNVRLPDTKKALNQFVNDGIGFRMSPEQILFYSYNAFGTADAISFRGKQLRIHDLKTGSTRVHMTQLEVYAALFCLEYDYEPRDIDIELRIYQVSKIIVHTPHLSIIKRIMEKIIMFDKKIQEYKLEEDTWL